MSLEYPVWIYPPDLTVIPTEGRTGMPDIIAQSSAAEFVSWPTLRSERILKFGFAWSVPREWHLAKAFWRDRGGRNEVFLFPSWARDFTVTTQPAAGALTLTVNVTNYGAKYLTTTHLDEVGRYLFCYDLVGGLFVAKVTASADSTTSALTIEQPFPFAPTREAIYGFALLGRFDEDETEWESWSPNHVKTSLIFRTVRENIQTPASGSLDGTDQYQSLGFTSFVSYVTDVVLSAKLATCLGPKNLHAPQNATYTDTWSCWPATSGGFRLLKNASPPVSPPDDTRGIISTVTGAHVVSENISIAFDQVAWEVIAWETDGIVSIARRQAGVPTTTSWTGRSPCVFFNGQVNVQARIDGTTDVVCYYIKAGQGGIFARFQRDNFGIEYVLGGFPTPPIRLTSHSVSGLVHTFSAVDVGFREMILSVTYPTQPDPLPDPYVIVEIPGDAVGGSPSLGDIAYEYGIVTPPAIQEAAGGAPSITDIENADVSPPPTNFIEGSGGSGAVTDIAYDVVIFGPPAQQEAAGAVAAVQDIAYDLAAIGTSPVQEAIAATPAITDIYYGP